MAKFLVLGYFGYNTGKLNGQTVKTRDLLRLVKEQACCDVDYFDTEDFKYNLFSVFKMLWKVICCDRLFYLPAHGNLKYIYPVIHCLSIIFRFKIHYIVIGGWLREFLSNLPLHRFMLPKISGIYVETRKMKNDLEASYGFKNVKLLSNFRFFDFTPSAREESQKLSLVFMARVDRMKGLDWIFYLCSYIQEKNLQHKFSLTFYGPINEDDRDYFESNVAKFDFVEYNGALQPNDIYKTLCKYDLLLLPTHYYTEGLPGTIVDAYISGVPVIVTAWKYAKEFVEDGESGFIIPFENGQNELVERVLFLEQNRTSLHKMQANALKKRQSFAPPQLETIL